MQRFSSTQKALLIAFAVLAVLAGLATVFFVSDGLAKINQTYVLKASIFVIIALVTVIVYQSVKISVVAKDIAKNMVKHLLAYSHELFFELYRGSPVPYILIDKNGNVESTNFAAVRLFHTKEGALDGQNVFENIESENPNKVGLFMEYLKQGVFVNEEEVCVRRLDGALRWALLSLFSFKDSEGTRKGLLTLIDITKQKQVDKAKTEFVSLASHQLRTPISAMKWNVELLHGASPETFTPLQTEYLLKIANGLGRMDLLVDDFLNVSKFELGTLQKNLQNVELVEFVTELLDEHKKKAETRQIMVEETWDKKPFQMQSDPQLLTMIIGNLVSNAIKYTKNAGVVHLRFLHEQNHTVITISDTGIGIPLDEQDQIFSKIFRASNARTQVSEGTGLGLYIVHEAVKVLGGTITFVSTEEVGTTFTVTLPD